MRRGGRLLTQCLGECHLLLHRLLGVHLGQDSEYVVVDDEKFSRCRVALAHEAIETYDAAYYETRLIKAVERVRSPLTNREPLRDALLVYCRRQE